MKGEVINVMVENIKDQNRRDSVAGIYSCLDLSSSESKEERIRKMALIHDIFGNKKTHDLDKEW